MEWRMSLIATLDLLQSLDGSNGAAPPAAALGFALLTALGLMEYIRKDRIKALAIGAGICSGIVFLVALGLLATQSIDLFGVSIYGPDEKMELLLGVGILFVWAAMAWKASTASSKRPSRCSTPPRLFSTIACPR